MYRNISCVTIIIATLTGILVMCVHIYRYVLYFPEVLSVTTCTVCTSSVPPFMCIFVYVKCM